MIGFISSPFIEDNNPWPIRQKIRLSLEQMGHQPWTWEVEGNLAQEKDLSTKSKDIISEAIRKSNLIVVVYKTRAGSLFNDEPIPVLATEFEVIEAIRFNIPILFYVISSSAREKELDGTISVFGNKIILNDRPIYCKDEDSLIERIRLDVKNLDYRSTKIIHPPSKNWMDSDDLNSIQEIIYRNFYVGEFGLALDMIENYSLVEYFSPRTKDEKVLLGKYWGHSGKIYAHSRKYKKAIQAVRRSIRLFMECGCYEDMFYQIEALSGIFNMSGINLAKNINGYAQRGFKLSNQLALRLRDSEASILRDQGEFQRALNLIEEDRDTTPYSGAKFAYLLSMTSKPGSIDKARLILEGNVLPKARLDSVDLEYVLRNAGIVAMKDGHTDQALSFFIEASDLCLRKGALHTKRGIDAIKRSIVKD